LTVARLVRGSADFFVAGRRLNAPLVFATVLASNIGAGATIGATGLGYRDGISAWWWSGSAAIGSIFLALFVGPRLWRIAAERNLYTAGDYLELRYGPTVRAIVASLIWLATLSILAGQLIAGAAVLTVVAGVPRWVGTMISALVTTATFVSGGLLGSTWVNAVQLVVLLCGFTAALPIVLGHAGGISGILANSNVPSTFGDFLHSSGPGSGWTFLIALGPAFIISPGLLQKAYGASSARAVKRGIGIQAIALAAFAFIPPLFGMAARTLHPGITDPNLVLPTLLVEQLSPALGALALAAVFSAEVNTCDALLFMLSTSLSQDLYKRFLRPQASDAQLLRVARWSAFAGGVGGVLFALRLATVIDALKIFYALLGETLLVPVIGGLYVRRAGSAEALVSMAAGIATLLVVRFAVVASYPWVDPTAAGLVAAAIAFALTLLVRGGTPGISDARSRPGPASRRDSPVS
jgi:SSS family solute:Na+ symporter